MKKQKYLLKLVSLLTKWSTGLYCKYVSESAKHGGN